MNGTTNELWPGWETVGILGAGGFGSVYEIQRDVFGRTERAALKTVVIPQHPGEIEELRQEGYDNASITARFHSYLEELVREYNMMAELKGCANIVYCDDLRYVQHADGFGWDLYIKMELLTPLLKALPPRATEAQVIQIGIDMCNALVLCKSKNIVHRDIKPQNIFVSNSGDFKLGDFGIAKTTERTASGTKTGTYKYMAPEVYNNQPYGLSVDQYSLGLVMHWLLNERRSPFLPLPPAVPRPGDEEEARYRRMSGQPIPEPMFGSKELKRIVLKACAFDPEDRFSTPEEMRNALVALQNSQGTTLFLDQDEDDSEGTVGVHLGKRFVEKQPVDPVDHGATDQKADDDTERPNWGKTAEEKPEKPVTEKDKVDLDVRAFVELSQEQAQNGCAVLVTLPHLGEKVRVQVPAGIQDGQVLRITGKGKTDTLFGFTGSLLVAVKIIPEKTPVGETADAGNNQLVADSTGKSKAVSKKDWSRMSDDELRKYMKQKGCKLHIIMAIICFIGGSFVGIGVPPLGFIMWGVAGYLIFDAVRVTKNAKKAEQEYFNRRKK